MVSEGFTVHDIEWWRFDHKDWRLYPIGKPDLRATLEVSGWPMRLDSPLPAVRGNDVWSTGKLVRHSGVQHDL
jgi:hypothetical protein